MRRHDNMSQMDEGFCLGWEHAALEVLQICQAHTDRLDPGKASKVREALANLEASIASNLLTRFGYRDPRFQEEQANDVD